MKGIQAFVMMVTVVLLLVLVRLSSNLVEGIPVHTTMKTPTKPTTDSEIRYVSISDITEDDDEFDEEEYSGGQVDGHDDFDKDESEDDWKDDDLSGDFGDFGEEPTYDDPLRGRRRRLRKRKNDLWKVNLNRTQGTYLR